jgi:hypothetical protein
MMTSHSPAKMPRFSMEIGWDDRETLTALRAIRGKSCSELIRDFIKAEGRRQSAEIASYRAFMASIEQKGRAA